MPTTTQLRLTTPDANGAFWFGPKTCGLGEAGPAIFPSKRLDGNKVIRNGSWIVFAGSKRGWLFQGESLRRFKTATEALDALNELLEGE